MINPYSQARFLRDPFGNNAFNYEKRSETNPEPSIRIAPLKVCNSWAEANTEIKFSTSPSFEVYEDNQLISKAGLENFLQFPNPLNPNCPVYLFDNHNHAFYFWHLSKINQQLPEKLTLLHFDQHKDTRIPASFLSPEKAQDLIELDNYTQEILNVGNFIPPAVKTNLLQTIEIIDSSDTLQKSLQTSVEQPYILDVDLDFFSPDLDYLDNQLKITAIKNKLAQANIVTFATSPFFIDQDLAINYLRKILN